MRTVKPTEDEASSREVRTDGGGEEESMFQTMSESDLSRNERIRRWLDAYIYTPFAIIWGDWRARIGLVIIMVYLFAGTIGVTLIPVPHTNQGPILLQPFKDPRFPLGTGGLGMDLLGLMVHATPAILKMVFAGAIVSTGVAALVGMLSGYKGGFVDRLLMTITDILLTIPGLTLTVVIVAIFEPRSPFIVGVILAINNWSGFARSLRSQVLTVREESYVEASRALGLSTPTIISFDLLPNLAPLVMINFMGSARRIIFESVGLYFLGLLPFTALNWGVVMNQAYQEGQVFYSLGNAHWFLVPMTTITLFTFGLIMFAQGTDRLFNPRIRARHADTGPEEIAEEDVASRGMGVQGG
ncbi:MAG: ABC transporter permease [Halobacteriaceae archaeon]